LQAGAALTVHRGAGHFNGQFRQQRNHASEIKALLRRLVGASPDHVLDFGGSNLGVAAQQFAQADSAEIVGADVLVIALVLARARDWRAHAVNDYCLDHRLTSSGRLIIMWTLMI